MPHTNIVVRQLSRPAVRFQLLNFRDPSDRAAPIDVTGYLFKLMVKNSLDLEDSRAFFDLSATIVTASKGLVQFQLTIAHTGLPEGIYPGEIRWYSDGVATNPPTDAVRVNFTVQPPVDNVVAP